MNKSTGTKQDISKEASSNPAVKKDIPAQKLPNQGSDAAKPASGAEKVTK